MCIRDRAHTMPKKLVAHTGHGVHTGVGHQLFGHGVGQLGVDDGDIGGDFKVSDRILDALFIIGNDGEGSHLGSSAGGGGDLSLIHISYRLS